MEFFNQNKNLILAILVIFAIVVGFRMMYQSKQSPESYQGDANQGGGRGLPGRGLKVYRFQNECTPKENDYLK